MHISGDGYYYYYLNFVPDDKTKKEEDFNEERLDKIYEIFNEAIKLYPLPKRDMLEGNWLALSKHSQNKYLIISDLAADVERINHEPVNLNTPRFQINLLIPKKLLQFKPGVVEHFDNELEINKSTILSIVKKIDKYVFERLLEENIISEYPPELKAS